MLILGPPKGRVQEFSPKELVDTRSVAVAAHRTTRFPPLRFPPLHPPIYPQSAPWTHASWKFVHLVCDMLNLLHDDADLYVSEPKEIQWCKV